ncbi:MAG: hypothetical protein ACI9W6_002214 [Motiliproteus sp.]|jgi:hypothetical protein
MQKNQALMNERGISFEDILFSIQQGDVLDDLVNPNSEKHPNQKCSS